MRKNRVSLGLILLLWPLVDTVLRKLRRIRPLRIDSDSIIGIELRRYNGTSIMLDDGSEVKAGDEILEIHLNSIWFRKRRSPDGIGASYIWKVIKHVGQDLCFLGEQIAEGAFEEVTALHGVTFLHLGARRLGFQVEELPDTLWKKFAQFYLTGLMQAYHLQADKVVDRPLELKEIWLSKAALLRRYSPHQP